MKYIDRLEDCIFIIKSRIEFFSTPSTTSSSTKENEYNNNKLTNGFNKAKELLDFIQKELIISNNDLIQLIKIKNILGELKNIFYKNELQELFEKIHNIIMEKCNHNFIDDYIDTDLDTSIKIRYCNICYCNH